MVCYGREGNKRGRLEKPRWLWGLRKFGLVEERWGGDGGEQVEGWGWHTPYMGAGW
jgi:hypothetical protein